MFDSNGNRTVISIGERMAILFRLFGITAPKAF